MLLIGLFALVMTPLAASAQTPPDEIFVSPADAARGVLAGGLLVDARSDVEYAAGHAPGAVHAPWADFSDPDTPGRLHPSDHVLGGQLGALGASRDRPTYVLGAWADGWGEEGRIFWMFEYLGYTDVHIVTGGWTAWVDAGLPVSIAPPEPVYGVGSIQRRQDLEATLRDVQALPATATLLDTRDLREFEGATPYGSTRGGHIPGARHVVWTDFLDGSDLVDRDRARELLGPIDAPVVAYCTGGVRSGFVYAVARWAGYEDVANYAGSWWEYSAAVAPTE